MSNMDDIEIQSLKKIADDEIDNPQWAESRQFLEVNKIEKINDEYVYERYLISDHKFYFGRIDDRVEKECHEILFYYRIENESYFYAIGVDIKEKEITRVFMVCGCYCYLEANSEKMTLNEMAKLTKLNYFDGASNGDKTNKGRGYYTTSWIEYKFTNDTSYFLEEALDMILDELEKDKKGIKKLAKKTEAWI